MEKAAEQITTEEIIVSPEEGVDEVKEQIKMVPSGLRRGVHHPLAALWERVSVWSRVSGSDVVVGSGLAGMYGAKFDALAKEHEQVRPGKG